MISKTKHNTPEHDSNLAKNYMFYRFCNTQRIKCISNNVNIYTSIKIKTMRRYTLNYYNGYFWR